MNIYHRYLKKQQRVENPFHPTKHFESSKYLPRILKFIYSEKATKFCEIFTLFLTGTKYICMTKVRWRFRKIFWPSKNIWTLITITSAAGRCKCPVTAITFYGPSTLSAYECRAGECSLTETAICQSFYFCNITMSVCLEDWKQTMHYHVFSYLLQILKL